MASGQVGRLSIRVLPDTTRFRSDLKKAVERVERTVTAKIDAAVNVTNRSLANAKRQLEGLEARIPATVDTDRIRESARRAKEAAEQAAEPIEVPAQIGDLDRRFLARLKAQAQRAADSVEASIPASIEGEGLRNNLRWQLDRIEKQMRAEIPVNPERAAAWRAELQHMVDDIEDHSAEITVSADPDTTYASARLSWLTRPRFVPIIPTLDAGATARVATALAALSGARLLNDMGKSLRNVISNIDRVAVKFGVLGTTIANLGSTVLAGTSNLLTLGGSLAAIFPLALALPGLFTGFGIGIGVMVAALKDAGTVLGDLGPQFSRLQDTISSNFWAEFEAPIRRLVSAWMPSLERGFSSIATQLGVFGASLATALSSADNVGHLDSILASVRDSIDIAGEGIAHFADAMMGLVDVGASYLPSLASWFNRISESFSAWVENATNSGEIFTWIDDGITALQDLGRVVWGIGGVFSNFTRAATAAGGASLGAFADGLANVNAALEGPIWQGALTTVFRGAHDAMAALGPGVSALGDAFLSLAPTLAQIMVLGGQIGSVALAGISAALQDPMFQGGMVALFEGVLSAVQALAPAMPALGAAFGSVAAFAGTLANVLGPVLGVAIEALAPVVTSLMSALSAIAPVLGGVLVSAITAVTPLIQQVAAAIAEWVQQNPGLATGLIVAAAAIGGLIMGAVSLITALAPLASSIIGIVGGLAGMGVSLGAVGSAIAGVLGPIAAVVAIAAALAAALVYAWTTSEQFRAAVAGLGQAILGFLQPIIAFITGTVVPVLVQIGQAILGAIQTVMDALVPLMTVVIQIVTQIIAYMTPLVAFILSVLAPIFTFLGTIVSQVFSQIGVIIAGAINIITAILQTFLALLQGNWAGVWQGLGAIVQAVWAFLVSLVTTSIAHVQTVITAGLTMIQGIWSAVWAAIGGVLSAIWAGILAAVSGALTAIAGFFSGILGGIASWVSGWVARIAQFFVSLGARASAAVSAGMNAVRSTFTSILSGVASFVSGVLSRIAGFFKSKIAAARADVSSGLNAIRSIFQSVLSAAASIVTSAISRIRSTFSSGLNAARSVVTSVLNSIRAAFTSILAGIVSAVTSGASRIVSGFRNGLSRALSAVRGFVGRFRSVGGQIISGLVGGIRSAAGRAVSAARDVVGNALNAAKNKLGIASPSKEFMKLGEYSGEGMIIGLEHKTRGVSDAMTSMVTPPSLPSLGPASGGNSSDELGGIDLSEASIESLADAIVRRPLVIGNRQAGMLAAAGAGTRRAMGGSW